MGGSDGPISRWRRRWVKTGWGLTNSAAQQLVVAGAGKLVGGQRLGTVEPLSAVGAMYHHLSDAHKKSNFAIGTRGGVCVGQTKLVANQLVRVAAPRLWIVLMNFPFFFD